MRLVMADPWPFVARQDQLRTTEDAVTGGSTVVVVEGGPGTGKSHYLHTVAARHSKLGRFKCISGTAATRALPLAAMAHLIARGRGAGRSLGVPDVVGLL